LVTRVPSSASGQRWRAFDAEAQLLASALRAGRLTVLVGALGAGKTTLLVDGVLPLLRRRVGDEPQQTAGAARAVVPDPDRRSRSQGAGHSQGEMLHFVDQWEAPLDLLVRALDELPAAARVRADLAEAMAPAHLAAVSQQHGGAHLLFVFDHFERLLERARHSLYLQRFVDAWTAAVQAPELSAHFLVAVDEHAWPRLRAQLASVPDVALQAFRLQARPGRQVLESLTDSQLNDVASKTEVSDADFKASIGALMSEVAKSVRETESGLGDFAASLNSVVSRVSRLARAADAPASSESGPASQQAFVESLGARLIRPAAAVNPGPDQAEPARDPGSSVQEAARVAAAEQRAEAEWNAEAVRQAEAVRLAEAQRLAQALAAAEEAAAREAQARQAAEAAAKAAEAEQRAEVERRAEAERNVEVQQWAQGELPIAAAATPLREAGASDAAAGLLAPAVANARPTRTGLLWGAALLAAAATTMLWWPKRPTPVAMPPAADSASASASALATAPVPSPDSASAAAGARAESARYEVVAAPADGNHSRITRELAGALATEAAAMRVVPLAAGASPITGLQAPGRVAVVRFDALRAARGASTPPLRVLTPLFPQEVLFVVRADSPLKYIHELRGLRLSIGPAQGDSSLTVREIYRQLFDAEMLEPAQFDNDQALAELVAFRSIDAMVIVEPQPSDWWASLDARSAHLARRLRPLTLDPRHPIDRRLLQIPGMSVARTGLGDMKDKRTTTPAVMSFLVASGAGDADVDSLTAMANALCRALPRLREQGHPKWRELQPAAQLDTGWPVVRQFQAVLNRCVRR
jgi:hypothetical protein